MKLWKVTRIIILALLFLFVTSIIREASAASKPTVFKYSITTSDTSTWYRGAVIFREMLENATDGRYSIEIYPNEQLSAGNMVTSLEMNQSGSIDLLQLSTFIYTNFDPRFNIVNTPWMFPTYEDMDRKLVTNGGSELLREYVRELGIVPIAIGASPYRGFSSNRGFLKNAEDFKNLKFRTCGINLHVEFFGSIGADPIAMNFAEVFTSLQQGALEGCEGIFDTYISSNLAEVQKYYTVSNYNPDVFVVSMSEAAWNKLPPEDQEAIVRVGREWEGKFTVLARNEEKMARGKVAERMEMYDLTAGEKAAFLEFAKPIYEKYKKNYTEELLKAFEYPL